MMALYIAGVSIEAKPKKNKSRLHPFTITYELYPIKLHKETLLPSQESKDRVFRRLSRSLGKNPDLFDYKITITNPKYSTEIYKS